MPKAQTIASVHADWLRLVEVSGPFVSVAVLSRVFPQGLPTVEPDVAAEVRRAHEEWEQSQRNQHGNPLPHPDPALHTAWVHFVLDRVLELPPELLLDGPALPPHLHVRVAEHGETLIPDLALVNPLDGNRDAGTVRLVVQRYSATQHLERAIPGMRWNASPAVRMAELLRGSGVPLGLVTNGEQWMLVNALPDLTTGFTTWYASVWQDEPLTLCAFVSLLGVQRFFGVADSDTLAELIRESANNQQEVTDQLGYQVRGAVEVLIQAIDREDKDRGRTLLAEQQPEDLYNAALTVMMRLVFLFCAEERGLLLLGEEIYDHNYAVSPLREQLQAVADLDGEEVQERASDAWARLLATFRAVYGGVEHEAMRLPAYGGHLFDPDRYPFLEGRTIGTFWRETPADPLRVDNRTVLHLLEALQMLEMRLPGSGQIEKQRLSFRALDIEQIGHVYEGLLDHTARRANDPVLGLDGKRDMVTEIPLRDLEAQAAKGEDALVGFLKERTDRSPNAIRKGLARTLDGREAQRLLVACDNNQALYQCVLPFAGLLRKNFSGYPVVYTPGSVYVTAGTDRRSTGTHYTPRTLTEPIVQHTLDPLCYVGPAEGRPREDWTLRPAAEILALKVCDMAMGSGAFLVQAARYLAEKLMEAWDWVEQQYRLAGSNVPAITPEGAPSEHPETDTLLPKDEHERHIFALRIVCDRCLYGVDKNAMAVEMARLSLWLITLDKGKPFTFLDHALRWGDSLLGISDVEQLRQWTLLPNYGAIRPESFIEPVINRALADALRLRREIEAHPVTSVADLEEKERLLLYAERAMDLVRLGADLLVATAIATDAKERDYLRNYGFPSYSNMLTVVAELRRIAFTEVHRAQTQAEIDDDIQKLRENLNRILENHHPFHWPLEFPEVFEGARQEGKELGFSAIVGNPPFMGGKKITGPLGTEYREYLVEYLGNGVRGHADLCAYFFLRAGQLLADGGDAGLLATNTIAQGDTREVGLDQLLAKGFSIPRAVPSRPWPGAANLEVAHIWMRNGDWVGDYDLDDKPVVAITAYLTVPGAANGKPYRLHASMDKSFIGSIVLGMGFVLEPEDAQALIAKDPRNLDVLFPYLNGEDLNSRPDQSPSRWVINFHDWPLERAETYPDCMVIVRGKVKPQRDMNKRMLYRTRWWQFAERCPGLYSAIAGMDRVLVISLVTHYASFGFVPANQVFAHKLAAFPFDQSAQFALLQSNFHEPWARQHSSNLRVDLNYTPTDCFETFPFPEDISGLEDIGEQYYTHRQSIMLARQAGLTKTYNRFHNPDDVTYEIEELRTLHAEMDHAVAAAYGWGDLDLAHGFHQTKQGLRFTISEAARREVLGRLLRLNHERHAAEVAAGLVDEKGRPVRNGKKGKAKAKPTPAAPAKTQPNRIAEEAAVYKPSLFDDGESD